MMLHLEFKRLGPTVTLAILLACLVALTTAATAAPAGEDAIGATQVSTAIDSSSVLTHHDLLVDQIQERVVKLFGAGGGGGLESYQSGILVGNDGHIATTWTTVLDVSRVRVVLYDGKKYDATMVGIDPANEIALLKIEGASVHGFDLSVSPKVEVGMRVFAVSNLFGIANGDEYCSVQRGVVMGVAPLTQRRGRTRSLFQGKVYVLDVMTNNPGASGGALLSMRGEFLGLLGKEIRDEQSGIWINYALPFDVVRTSLDRILNRTPTNQELSGADVVENPHLLPLLGLTLIPDVLPKTPAFVDQVRSDSIASRAGLQTNDLILLLNDQRVDSRKSFERALSSINRADSFELLVQRGHELIRIQVRP